MTTETRYQVRRVLIITLILNLVVAFGKITLGLLTGALAITADGFHSMTDGAGNIVGLIANFIAARPPDDDHPYGHRRFETVAALFIGALLLLTAWEMLQSVLQRLRLGATPEITPLTFVVLIATLIINIFVSRYQIGEGQKLNSEILLADAKNTSADVFVTLSVIISTALVSLTGWVGFDLMAAFVVVLLIARAAWEILAQTGRVLVDEAPYSSEKLSGIITTVPNVDNIVRARSRGPADAAHIDIDLYVPPEMTTEQSNSIRYAISQRLKGEIAGIAEIEVHFVPHHANGRNAMMTARAYADARGLSAHEIQLNYDERGTVLEMHVEVPRQQTLVDAHGEVSDLEDDILGALPNIDRIVTHIEPAQELAVASADTKLINRATQIQTQAQHLLQQHYPDVGWHDWATRSVPHGVALSVHATLSALTSVEDAHEISENAETLLRARISGLHRVIIHTEPFDHEG